MGITGSYEHTVRGVLHVYPEAFACADSAGVYIVDDSVKPAISIGYGRSPLKAWLNAYKNIYTKKKRGSRPGLKTPQEEK